MKAPKVLILDDSTSAVDTATDARIRQAFANVIPGTTKLIIPQRISSVQDAGRILMLDGGAVNGFDTHENFLTTNEIYRVTSHRPMAAAILMWPAPGRRELAPWTNVNKGSAL